MPASQAQKDHLAKAGKDTQWKPGQSGNPNGAPKAKVQFWPHVQRYAEMTDEQIAEIDVSSLTLSEKGALEYAIKLSQCEWQQVKEALDRDEGPIEKKVAIRDEREPVTPFSELPQAEQKKQLGELMERLEDVE